ncbi:unnamed protein product [Cyclocybe aegerita]|uniref:Uncharacterized protein n=1 Tax=Cyclocybe aegerita TaxID=1973307 RepID=A0A8S0WAP7_CYCAE|nr:unnamed protein product [Cyclocybe aegerita]
MDTNGPQGQVCKFVGDLAALGSSQMHGDIPQSNSFNVVPETGEARSGRFVRSLVDVVILSCGSTEAPTARDASDLLTKDVQSDDITSLSMRNTPQKSGLMSDTFACENLLQLRQRRIGLWNAELDRIYQFIEAQDSIPIKWERELLTIQQTLLAWMKEHLQLYRQYVELCRREVAVEMFRAQGLDNQRARGRNTL